MQIDIIAVGKIKENWLKQGIAEYTKRMRQGVSIKIHEVQEESILGHSDKEIMQLLHVEGERIIKAIPKQSLIFSLSIEGKVYTSEELSDKLNTLCVKGNSRFSFIIGSSFGLSQKVYDISHERLSLSSMTFPHQLCRLILIEQLYRAHTIISGKTYHK